MRSVHAARQQHVVAARDERHRIGAQHVGSTDVEAGTERGKRRRWEALRAQQVRHRGVGVARVEALSIRCDARERGHGIEHVGG